MDQINGFAVQVMSTPGVSGTLKIQGSCDIPLGSQPFQPASIVNWTSITAASASYVNGSPNGSSEPALFNVTDVYYNWFRLNFTATAPASGSVNYNVKRKAIGG